MRPSYPLSGQLMTGGDSFLWLKQNLPEATGSIMLCSAFVKKEALSEIAERVPAGIKLKILVRWRLSDLVAGASDIDSYLIAKSRGWAFYIRTDFHGKVYAIPGKGILIGSANATSSGFSLIPNANAEICTVASASSDNLLFIDSLYSNSIRLTDELYGDMVRALPDTPPSPKIEWPDSILQKIKRQKNLSSMFVGECFLFDPSEKNIDEAALQHDLGLIGNFTSDSVLKGSGISLQNNINQTKIICWLRKRLLENNGELYFGHITKLLHDALLDNPSPYRREVKQLVQNMIGWVSYAEFGDLVIDRPNYSQRIRLLDSTLKQE